jgi:hypothetical protein
MSINELNHGSVGSGSWSQFVRLKEAAKERGFGQPVKGGASVPGSSPAAAASKFSEILSSKGGNNVYLDPNVKALQSTLAAVRGADLPVKGKMFDTWA